MKRSATLLKIAGVSVLRIGAERRETFRNRFRLFHVTVLDADIKNLLTVQVLNFWIELNYGIA